MVGDGFTNYHHENDGMGTLLGGCHAEIVNTEHPVRAKIIYASKTLEVKHNVKIKIIANRLLLDSLGIKF